MVYLDLEVGLFFLAKDLHTLILISNENLV
jgi:hypothetical protein